MNLIIHQISSATLSSTTQQAVTLTVPSLVVDVRLILTNYISSANINLQNHQSTDTRENGSSRVRKINESTKSQTAVADFT